MNTCCPLTQAHYAQFCGHVTAVAMLDKDLVPVTNRYALVESKMSSLMHGYVLDIPVFAKICFYIIFLQMTNFIFATLLGQVNLLILLFLFCRISFISRTTN